MKNKIMILGLAATLALGACAEGGTGEPNAWGMGNKQTIGTAGGALVGGILGSRVGKGSGQVWATGAGAVLGALAGSSIGKSLDQADMMYHQRAIEQSFNAPLNQQINWNNAQNGHSGSVTAIDTGSYNGRPCRRYRQTIVIDGQAQSALGTACQNPDGTWALQNG